MSDTGVMGEESVAQPGSGNVFADLELPEPEEALTKATLAMRIGQLIAHRRLSQTEAARVMGIDQPKVSALVRGRLTMFSTERLLCFLNALDQDVEIVVRPKQNVASKAIIRVTISDNSMPIAATGAFGGGDTRM